MAIRQQLSLFGESALPPLKVEYEYLIIITPSNEIKRYVKECNKAINNILGNKITSDPFIAHITLIYHKGNADIDELFIMAMENIAKEVHQFTIKLKGFDYFERPNRQNVFYISIDNKEDIKQVYEALGKELEVELPAFTPHITLKRHIKRDNFSLIQENFQNTNYEAEFLCDRITLLKKKIVPKEKSGYKLVHETELLK